MARVYGILSRKNEKNTSDEGNSRTTHDDDDDDDDDGKEDEDEEDDLLRDEDLYFHVQPVVKEGFYLSAHLHITYRRVRSATCVSKERRQQEAARSTYQNSNFKKAYFRFCAHRLTD